MTDHEDRPETPARARQRPPFVRELYQRGVVQAGIAYLIVGWLLIQIADVIADKIGLPALAPTFVTFTVIGGFPIALLLAWFLEYAEGQFIVDEGKQAGRVVAGLGRNYLAVIGAYAIAAVGATAYQFAVGFSESDTPVEASTNRIEPALPVDPSSIAVLKFLNIDGSDSSQIFSEGLAEDLLDRLAKIPGLLVSSRGDSWSLPDNASSRDVRQRLRVAHFVEGSVRLDGETLRTVVQLIDSETGFHIVSRTFDRKLENVLVLQNEITALIAANLRIALPPDTQLGFGTSFSSDDVDAYILYRRGRELFEQPQNEESLQRVIEFYADALDIDEGYAAAHAGLCNAFVALHRVSGDTNHIAVAESECASALRTNGNLHMVYKALGNLYFETGRATAAQQAYEQALKINSQDASALQGLAKVYEAQLRFADAEELLQKAIRLQPGNWRSIDDLGWFFFANGRYVEAANAYRQVTELDPGNWQGHGNLGSALLMAGDFEAAGSALRRALASEEDPVYLSNLGVVYYYLGQFDDAVAIHLEVVDSFPDSNIDWLNLADALSFSSTPTESEAAYRTAADLSEAELQINQRGAGTLYRLAWAVANLGDFSYARELIDRSRSIDPKNPYVHYYSGLINARERQHNAAVADLQQAVAAGYPTNMLATDPLLADLHGFPAFIDLIDPAK